jgi:hypothetical protein
MYWTCIYLYNGRIYNMHATKEVSIWGISRRRMNRFKWLKLRFGFASKNLVWDGLEQSFLLNRSQHVLCANQRWFVQQKCFLLSQIATSGNRIMRGFISRIYAKNCNCPFAEKVAHGSLFKYGLPQFLFNASK